MNWKLITGIALGTGVVFVAVKAFAKDAAEEDKPDPDAPEGVDRKIRHGIAHEGCAHFELVDPNAIESWASGNPMAMLKWLPQLDSLKQDPEPLMLEVWGSIFPECPWPPPESTTFGPQRGTWAQSVDDVRQLLANYEPGNTPGLDMGTGPDAAGQALLEAMVVAFGGRR